VNLLAIILKTTKVTKAKTAGAVFTIAAMTVSTIVITSALAKAGTELPIASLTRTRLLTGEMIVIPAAPTLLITIWIVTTSQMLMTVRRLRMTMMMMMMMKAVRISLFFV
jgi:hypothetical protein